jgi:hypothetical protein
MIRAVTTSRLANRCGVCAVAGLWRFQDGPTAGEVGQLGRERGDQ